jgi:predicted transcriptional regulator
MNEQEAKRILEELKKYTEETTSSKEKALQALFNAGLVKADGQPTDLYKN